MAKAIGLPYLAPELVNRNKIHEFVKSLQQVLLESIELLRSGHEDEFIAIVASVNAISFQALYSAKLYGYDHQALQRRVNKKALDLLEDAQKEALKNQKKKLH